jgi:hypothetical protein
LKLIRKRSESDIQTEDGTSVSSLGPIGVDRRPPLRLKPLDVLAY